MASFSKDYLNPIDWIKHWWPDAKDIKYTIGPMRIATVYGMVDLRCGRYPGQRERVKIPVKCEYILK